MKLIVGINNIKIDEKDKLNAGEYNIHEVEFEFDEVYENLVKKAVFSEGKHNYLVSIENNKCTIPYEVLEKNGDINIGVYAYDVEDDELVLRYSPSPVYLYVNLGSYKDSYDNYEVPTPDTVEQMEAEINLKQDRLVSGTNIKTINNQSILGEGNIDIQGGGTYTAGANIQISSENVISATDTIYDDTQVKQDITNLQNNKANVSDIPDVSSFITKDVNDLTYYTKSSDLSSVATSGSYTDLSNKPTIPDVSNFVTKDVNDLTYYTLATDTGHSIELDINSSTYVVTLSLKNSAGTVLNSDTIDLPLESVVVGGSYDSTNKKVILTLQNGNTIEFSVADLVSGLQSEITSSNKLSSDLVDDTNKTNKFVTSAEKTKIDVINTSGTGSSYLANDGTYKEVVGFDTPYVITRDNYDSETTLQKVNEAYQKFLLNKPYNLKYYNSSYSYLGTLDLKFSRSATDKTIYNQLKTELIPMFNSSKISYYYGYVNLTYTNDVITQVVISATYHQYLSLNNTQIYTPSSDYHPATKKYVDDKVGDIATALDSINGESI